MAWYSGRKFTPEENKKLREARSSGIKIGGTTRRELKKVFTRAPKKKGKAQVKKKV